MHLTDEVFISFSYTSCRRAPEKQQQGSARSQRLKVPAMQSARLHIPCRASLLRPAAVIPVQADDVERNIDGSPKACSMLRLDLRLALRLALCGTATS